MNQRNAPVRGRRSLPALAVLFLVVMSLGCISAPTYCYTATAATVHAVDLGMNVAGDLYRAGKISEAQKATIVKVHNVYRPLADGVVTACEAVKNQADADAEVKKMQAAADPVLSALVSSGAR